MAAPGRLQGLSLNNNKRSGEILQPKRGNYNPNIPLTLDAEEKRTWGRRWTSTTAHITNSAGLGNDLLFLNVALTFSTPLFTALFTCRSDN